MIVITFGMADTSPRRCDQKPIAPLCGRRLTPLSREIAFRGAASEQSSTRSTSSYLDSDVAWAYGHLRLSGIARDQIRTNKALSRETSRKPNAQSENRGNRRGSP